MEANLVFLVIGAAAAALVALLLVMLEDLWSDGLLPLWRRWRYRGVNVAGGWKGLGTGYMPAPGEWTEVGLRLEQQARELRGMLWIRRCCGERTSELRVPLAGSITGNYATLAAAPDDRSPPAHASALLKIDGACLMGQLLYRDAHTDFVDGIHLSVYRASSMALPNLRPLHEGLHAAAAGAA